MALSNVASTYKSLCYRTASWYIAWPYKLSQKDLLHALASVDQLAVKHV